MTYDSGRYEENMDWAMEIADWKGFETAPPRSRQARQAARPRTRQLCRVVDRRAQRAGAHHGPSGGTSRRGDRHPAERPGPRDQLRAGRVRPSPRPARKREDHSRRHRRGEGRRRLAFGPLHAPRRHRVLQGRRRPDRERQAYRRDHPRIGARQDRVQRRPFCRARHQSHVRFPRARQGSRQARSPRRPRGRCRGGDRQ